ncbi:MAG: hypothetical protein ABL933_10185 [Methyloglobulus sp.]|nr:hypothetical protein [Methyloglobulus sp.]
MAYFDFNKADADNFYGRGRLTDDCLAHIRQHNFLALLGASGSGKSSLIRAGLLYSLQSGGKIAGSEHWRQYLITPTDNPLQRLARLC